MVLLTKEQQQNEANIYEHKIASNNGESDYTHCLKYYSVLFKYFFDYGIHCAFGHPIIGEKICLTFNYIGRVFYLCRYRCLLLNLNHRALCIFLLDFTN